MDREQVSDMSRRERKKEETKAKITGVAMELFEKNDFENTTMEQIAEKADVARGTLYNYFPVKEAIIGHYFRQSFQDISPEAYSKFRQQFPDTRARLGASMQYAAGWLKKNKKLMEVYIGYRMQNAVKFFRNEFLRSGFEEVLTTILTWGQEDGELRRDVSARKMARNFEVLYLVALTDWLINPEENGLEEGLAAAVDFFLNGAYGPGK